MHSYYAKGNRPHRTSIKGSHGDQEVLLQTLRLEIRDVRRRLCNVQDYPERRRRRLHARQEGQTRLDDILRQRGHHTSYAAEGEEPRRTNPEEEKGYRRW